MGSVTFVSHFRAPKRGFTLLEVLIVIGIIAILAAVVIVAINPARQFAQARNSQRISNINAILNAIGERMADNRGVFQGGGCLALPTSTTTLDMSGGANSPGTQIDLATSCLVPAYLPLFPNDPSSTSTVSSGYTVDVDSNGRTIVCAPDAALETALADRSVLCVMR